MDGPCERETHGFPEKDCPTTAQCVLTDGLPSKLLQDQEVLHLLNTLLSLGAGAGGGRRGRGAESSGWDAGEWGHFSRVVGWQEGHFPVPLLFLGLKCHNLWDTIKCTNICITGVPEGEEREKGSEKIFEEIVAKNFPNTGEKTATQVQEVQSVPRRNPRRNMSRHIGIKHIKIKDKEKILKHQEKSNE